MRQIKETCCTVAFNPIKLEEEAATVKQRFKLPDGNTIDLGPEVRDGLSSSLPTIGTHLG